MSSSHVHGIVSVPSVFCVFGIRLVAVSPNPSASTTDNVVELVTDPVAPEFTVKLQTASVTGVVAPNVVVPFVFLKFSTVNDPGVAEKALTWVKPFGVAPLSHWTNVSLLVSYPMSA